MTSKEAKEKYATKSYYLTVGRLKEELAKYPDDALVVSQRVEDFYYEENGWQTVKKPDPLYSDQEQQYSPVWCVVHYKDDQDCLFLDLHY
jgi:hypothetical protein